MPERRGPHVSSRPRAVDYYFAATTIALVYISDMSRIPKIYSASRMALQPRSSISLLEPTCKMNFHRYLVY